LAVFQPIKSSYSVSKHHQQEFRYTYFLLVYNHLMSCSSFVVNRVQEQHFTEVLATLVLPLAKIFKYFTFID